MDIVPLVEFVDGAYTFDQNTLEWLKTLEPDFSVCCCAGTFRTGKSFLLNRLIGAPPGKGFGVGETVQPCTRGIWLCKTLIDGKILVMDTEGIDALDASSAHDIHVFAMAILFSSMFLYNSQSHIDEKSIQTLALMTRIADSVSSSFSPQFYWILRDFSLQLTDAEGKVITHKDYLEQSLSTLPGEKCKTREAIKQVFKTRFLVTLPRPHKTDSSQKLDLKGSNGISAKFEKFLGLFRAHMLHHAIPMSANGASMSGSVYVTYITDIVRKLNEKGVVPNVSDTWSMLERFQEAERAKRIKDDIVNRISAECPRGSKEQIVQWILQFDYSSLPSDAATGMHDELMRLCENMNKVLSATEVFTAELEGIIEKIVNGNEVRLDNLSTEARTTMYFLKRAFEQGRESGYTDKSDELFLKMEMLQSQYSSVLEELNELKKERYNCTSDSVKVDCCVGTSDDIEDVVEDDATEETARSCQEVVFAMQLNEQKLKIDQLTGEVSAYTKREEAMKAVFEQNMLSLETKSQEVITNLKDTITGLIVEKDIADEQCKHAIEQKKALLEENDKTRLLLKEVQERTIEIHKNALEEMSKREAEHRSESKKLSDDARALHVKMEVASSESRGLKRQVEELSQVQEESKLARRAVMQVKLEKVKEETTNEQLRMQLENAKDENDRLRALCTDLSNRNAVLHATTTLDALKKKLIPV